jgi:sarcosine oxidase
VKRTFEYIVIGAGGTGAATANQLARRGVSVALIERFQIGHDKGSSHGHSRIFRFAYDRPEYTRMAMEALRAWRELEVDAEEQLLTPTGGLDLGPEGTASLEKTTQSLSEVGAEFDLLDAAQIVRRFPQWRVPDDWMGVYSEDAGIVNPTETVEVLAAAAQAHGATLLEWTPVTQIHLGIQGGGSDPITLETARGTFSCRKLVIAAGGWLNELMPDLKLPLSVTLEASVFFRPQRIDEFRVGRFPVFIEHGGLAYGFPVFGLPGVKIGLHHGGALTTASARDFAVPPEMIERLRAFLEAHLPRAAGRVIQAKTCLYTNTPGTDFLIDTHANIVPGGSEDIIIASPCSGHGFKFVPLIGEILADAAMGRQHPFWLPQFRNDMVIAAT